MICIPNNFDTMQQLKGCLSPICPPKTGNYKVEETRIFLVLLLLLSKAQGTPPWILKRRGPESFDTRLISLNGQTKRIAPWHFVGFLDF